MENFGVGALGSIFPEIILLIGGMVILLLDMAQSDEQDSGSGFMAVAVLFLALALVGSILQMNGIRQGALVPHTALAMVDVDTFAIFLKIAIYTAMMLVAGQLRVVLVTTHVALRDVHGLLTTERVVQTGRITNDALRRWWHLPSPRLAVSAEPAVPPTR